MDWDKLRIFDTVARAGSFTGAGKALNLSQSAVSRQISVLEDSLGIALFHRHARGLLLTERGESLYQATQEMSHRVAMAEAVLSDATDKPSGEIKVTTTVAFGSTWLTPRLGEFLDRYPEVSVTVLVSDRELDLGMREADIGIRMRSSTQPDLVQRRLLTVHHHVYASPVYLQRYGRPQAPEELEGHRLIIWGEDAAAPVDDVNWLMRVAAPPGAKRRPALKVNNGHGLMLAVESGLGIAALPDYMVKTSERVERILPDLEGPVYDTYFVYPEELRNSKRIAIFRDFLLDKVAEWEF